MKLLLYGFFTKVCNPIVYLTFGFLTILLLISGCTKDKTTTTIT